MAPGRYERGQGSARCRFSRECRNQQRPQPPIRRRLAAAARGINENYAREIMELHTLGVDGGYTQKDVQEVARCFTGWTIATAQAGR